MSSNHIGAIPDALKNFSVLPDEAHVKIGVIAALEGCSTATIRRRVKDGSLPRPHRLTPGLLAFNVGEYRRLRGIK